MENNLVLTGVSNNVFCSIKANSDDEAKKLFNALETCDALLNDLVGEEINMKDLYIEERKVQNDNGEEITKYRTIIFDTEGKTYATASYGVFNTLKKIIAIYGSPTWENGVKVTVAKRPIGNGKSSLTLTLV